MLKALSCCVTHYIIYFFYIRFQLKGENIVIELNASFNIINNKGKFYKFIFIFMHAIDIYKKDKLILIYIYVHCIAFFPYVI